MANADPKEDSTTEAEISIRVRFMGDLRAIVGQRDLRMALPRGNTVGDLLAFLSNSFGEPFASWVFSRPGIIHHYILVFLNGQNIQDVGGLATGLGDGDSEVEIIMLPMFEGG